MKKKFKRSYFHDSGCRRSWAHGFWFAELYWVWIVTDLINTLQGVLIFIVIGCQPQVSNLKYTYSWYKFLNYIQVCNVLTQLWRSESTTDFSQCNSSSAQAASSLRRFHFNAEKKYILQYGNHELFIKHFFKNLII